MTINSTMRLTVLLPDKVYLDVETVQVDVEAIDGARTFLPNHMDFFTVLPTSIVSYRSPENKSYYLAIDHGLLAKCLGQITLTCHHSVSSDTVSALRSKVQDQFVNVDEQQRHARKALARLEAGAIRQFINLDRG